MKSDEERKIVPLPRSTFIVMIFAALLVLGGAVFVTSRVNQETQALGQCVMEQLVLHRQDNRGTHEAMSKEHFELNPEFQDRSIESLPPPPHGLPEPRDDVEERLLDACKRYLELGD